MTIMIAMDIEYIESDLWINKVCILESDVHNNIICTHAV